MSPFLYLEVGIRRWVFTLLTQASLEVIRRSKFPTPATLVLREFRCLALVCWFQLKLCGLSIV